MDGGDAETSIEAQPQVQHDSDRHQQYGDRAVLDQLFAYLRADEVHSQQLDRRVISSQRPHHLLAHLRAGDLLPGGKPNQRSLRAAEALHGGIGQADLLQGRTDFVEIGGLPIGQFHDRAASELDAEVQPTGDQEEHRQQKHDERYSIEYRCPLHEVDVFTYAEEFHLLGLVLALGLRLERGRSYLDSGRTWAFWCSTAHCR